MTSCKLFTKTTNSYNARITSGLSPAMIYWFSSSIVSIADKDLTCCPVSSVSGCRKSGTAGGKVEQLLTLCVVHVTYHTPEHPCEGGRREGRVGKRNGVRGEG